LSPLDSSKQVEITVEVPSAASIANSATDNSDTKQVQSSATLSTDIQPTVTSIIDALADASEKKGVVDQEPIVSSQAEPSQQPTTSIPTSASDPTPLVAPTPTETKVETNQSAAADPSEDEFQPLSVNVQHEQVNRAAGQLTSLLQSQIGQTTNALLQMTVELERQAVATVARAEQQLAIPSGGADYAQLNSIAPTDGSESVATLSIPEPKMVTVRAGGKKRLPPSSMAPLAPAVAVGSSSNDVANPAEPMAAAVAGTTSSSDVTPKSDPDTVKNGQTLTTVLESPVIVVKRSTGRRRITAQPSTVRPTTTLIQPPTTSIETFKQQSNSPLIATNMPSAAVFPREMDLDDDEPLVAAPSADSKPTQPSVVVSGLKTRTTSTPAATAENAVISSALTPSPAPPPSAVSSISSSKSAPGVPLPTVATTPAVVGTVAPTLPPMSARLVESGKLSNQDPDSKKEGFAEADQQWAKFQSSLVWSIFDPTLIQVRRDGRYVFDLSAAYPWKVDLAADQEKASVEVWSWTASNGFQNHIPTYNSTCLLHLKAGDRMWFRPSSRIGSGTQNVYAVLTFRRLPDPIKLAANPLFSVPSGAPPPPISSATTSSIAAINRGSLSTSAPIPQQPIQTPLSSTPITTVVKSTASPSIRASVTAPAESRKGVQRPLTNSNTAPSANSAALSPSPLISAGVRQLSHFANSAPTSAPPTTQNIAASSANVLPNATSRPTTRATVTKPAIVTTSSPAIQSPTTAVSAGPSNQMSSVASPNPSAPARAAARQPPTRRAPPPSTSTVSNNINGMTPSAAHPTPTLATPPTTRSMPAVRSAAVKYTGSGTTAGISSSTTTTTAASAVAAAATSTSL
jgi:hypothetical protein